MTEQAPVIEQRMTRSLKTNPSNLRRHSREKINAMKRILLAFGQVPETPLVVKGDVVYKGNGTLTAMLELLDEGHDQFQKAWVSEAGRDGEQLDAWAVADNRASELSDWDEPALAKALEEMRRDETRGLEDVGFNEGELEALLEEVALMAQGVDHTENPQGGHPFQTAGGAPEAPPGAENPPETPAPPPEPSSSPGPPQALEALEKLTIKLPAAKKTQLLEDLALIRDREKLKDDGEAICYLAEVYCRGAE